MSDAPPPQKPGEWFGWKRAGDYIKSILTLERSVRALKEENETLRRDIDRLKQLVDDHNGQLKVLLTVFGSNLDDRIASKAESAAVDVVTWLLEARDVDGGRPTED